MRWTKGRTRGTKEMGRGGTRMRRMECKKAHKRAKAEEEGREKEESEGEGNETTKEDRGRFFNERVCRDVAKVLIFIITTLK
jgi:hypothetical protein